MKKYKVANGDIRQYYPKGYSTYHKKTYKKARFRKARNRNLHMRWKLDWTELITWDSYKDGLNYLAQPGT